ncbi:alpha/beta hydrolase-fold protein [Frigoriglobus tundricola]|uniref:Putative esterase n=1 Tax=Frigoriglobus tundricola TaxID=2774151 RepID=A0A6M5YHR2_9BACT|nr:alpha/beta hydrolase-fold protein [Frigoriglobus tundricola]QJW92803.1 putative esterase [Frigoriglobus tundricola]
MLDGWTRVTIGAKAADVFAPIDALPQCVLYLHSLAEESPATDAAFTAALRRHRLRCLAPCGGWCWWADRVCPEFDPAITPERFLLNVLVPWAEAEWHLGPRAVALVGAEMGGQGAMRIAFRHPERFPVVASLAGALDCQDWYGRGTPLDEMYESRERCRLDTAILHLDGHHWPRHIWFWCAPADATCYRGNDRLYEKLSAMGVPHTADLDTRASPDQMIPPVLDFVASALAKEAKRLM